MSKIKKIKLYPLQESFLIQINVYSDVPPVTFSFRLKEKTIKSLLAQLRNLHKENV